MGAGHMSGMGFDSRQHHGPVANGSSAHSRGRTTSSTETTPSMQPRGRSLGTASPNDSRNRVPSASDAVEAEAVITNGPRWRVVHERFSTVLWPVMMAHAQGCRIASAFMTGVYGFFAGASSQLSLGLLWTYEAKCTDLMGE